MILIPDVTPDKRWFELHDHMPSHSHNIVLAFPSRTDQDDWTGFEESSDIRNREIFFYIFHGAKVMLLKKCPRFNENRRILGAMHEICFFSYGGGDGVFGKPMLF